MAEITMESVVLFPALHCAHCAAELAEGFAWDGGETIQSDMTPDNCHPAIMWGECPQCAETNFCLDISVVPDCPSGNHLVSDHTHEADSVSYYTVNTDSQSVPWNLEHYTDVTGVTFHSTEKDHDDPPPQGCAWLDIGLNPTKVRKVPLYFL